jgi:hypothetical protein
MKSKVLKDLATIEISEYRDPHIAASLYIT